MTVHYVRKVFPLIIPDNFETCTDADGIALLRVVPNKSHRIHFEAERGRIAFSLPRDTGFERVPWGFASYPAAYEYLEEEDRFVATTSLFTYSVRMVD